MMTLGTKLSKMRREKNLTQSEISEKLEVSQNAYNKWESDKAKPTMENLLKIAEYYHTDIYDLLGDTGIVQNNHEKATGIIHHKNTVTINNNFPENLAETVMKNQEQISQLIQSQNQLIIELLKK